MRVYRGLPNAGSRLPCALAIGNFDGVHRGHQALLAEVRAAARRLHLSATVMTFEPHPREFFAAQAKDPSRAPARIANLRDKLEALSDNSIDRVIVERFNTRFANLSAQQFIDDVLVKGCDARWIMVGDDFCFGARRAGTVATLKAAGIQHGFEVHTLPTVLSHGERVSSSSVRAALAAGDLVRADDLLGHGFFISGHVIHGKKLGRTIGFPTINLPIAHNRIALGGIFTVRVYGVGAEPIPGVASLGARPTVDDSGRILLEVHLLDFAGQVYGNLVRVEFLSKLRDEMTYPDVTTLTAAISQDVHRAREFFGLSPLSDSFATSASDRITFVRPA